MDGHGVPTCVKQSVFTKQDEVAMVRDTLKVAKLEDDPKTKNIICTSLYDQRAFYMIPTGQMCIRFV